MPYPITVAEYPIMVYLVGHGQTTYSAATFAKSGVCGWVDVALNVNGERKAMRVGEHLEGRAITRIYSSDFQRASRTANTINKNTGSGVVIKDRAYAPWRLGSDIEGEIFEDVSEDIIDLMEDPDDDASGGCESFNTFISRFVPALNAIKDTAIQDNQNMVLVTQPVNLEVAKAWHEGGERAQLITRFESLLSGAVATCDIMKFGWDGSAWHLIEVTLPDRSIDIS